MARVDYLLTIEGIAGECRDAKHKGDIELTSFSWGAEQGGTHVAGGGGGAGKVHMHDFHFATGLNKASPKLMLACASGEHLKRAVLTCRKAGKDQQEYLKITMSDLLVTAYETGGPHEDVLPGDQVSLNFARIEFEYREQKPNGTLGAPYKAGWDLKENRIV